MYTVKEIYGFIDDLAPFSLQEGYDNSGLCVGNMGMPADRILLALDCTADVAREAVSKNVQLVVTHHPVIFRGIKQLDPNSVAGILVRGGVSVLSAHTNFDSAVMNRIAVISMRIAETLRIRRGVLGESHPWDFASFSRPFS